MRDLHWLDYHRGTAKGKPVGDGGCGIFSIPSKTDGQPLAVIASSDYGWDHVSVSRKSRCPNWPEMEQIRRMFFKDDEAVYQYHAPLADYVDGSYMGHPFCLHLWRPHNLTIPVPPKWMVGGMPLKDALKAADAAEASEAVIKAAKTGY